MARITREQPKQQRAIDTREALLEGAARVFTRLTYAEARLKDIAAESKQSEGTIYFHFGNKSDIAAAVLEEQQERMTAVLTRVLARSGSGSEKLILVIEKLGELISTDKIVQGGISLAGRTDLGMDSAAREPYFEWIRIAKTLLQHGIEDGSISANTDVDSAAEFINSLFIGAQSLSGISDSWASLPGRLGRLLPYMTTILSPGNDRADDESEPNRL